MSLFFKPTFNQTFHKKRDENALARKKRIFHHFPLTPQNGKKSLRCSSHHPSRNQFLQAHFSSCLICLYVLYLLKLLAPPRAVLLVYTSWIFFAIIPSHTAIRILVWSRRLRAGGSHWEIYRNDASWGHSVLHPEPFWSTSSAASACGCRRRA